MAFRYETNQNGDQDLVIDGFEKGIADSPYLGIANMRNLNTSWYPGVAYTNYKRIRVNSAGGNATFTGSASPAQLALTVIGSVTLNVGDAVTLTTTTTLPSPLATATTYFVQAINSGTGVFQLSATLGGSAIVITGAGTGTHTLTLTAMGKPSFATQNTSDGSAPYGTVYILDKNGRVWQNTGTSGGLPYFVLLFGNTVDGSTAQGLGFYGNYLIVFRGTSIDICGNGTGAVTSSLWTNSWFASTGVTFTGSLTAGDTSGTLTAPWAKATGTYNLTFANESVIARLTLGSSDVTWTPSLLVNETSSANVNLGNSGSTRMAYMDASSDILYFCNGRYVGALSTPSGRVFNKQLTNPDTAELNFAAVSLPVGIFSSWLDKIQQNLLIAAQDTIYPWDRVALFTGIPIPITENIYRMVNASNIVYIFAGVKGNIYKYNGFASNVVKKIPDSIAGVIDPLWGWGGLIPHRQNVYFTVWAQNAQTNANILNGIMSIADDGTINFENQNSNGLTNASATADAVMFDVNTSNYDSYYSSWYDGTTGGIDYNSTTLYSSNEPVIETDIIPIGTFAQSHTFSSMEFKLDQPMQSGDSITVYARSSLSDTYTQVGTTTTAVLSDFYQPINFQKYQWVQFKITISCNPTATSSSFVRLREIRIR